MNNEVITLISIVQAPDEYGDLTETETGRQVFCRVQSVGSKEFYQANALGLQPELKFVLADWLDWAGETAVEYQGLRYRVLRSYRTGLALELTCYREVNKT